MARIKSKKPKLTVDQSVGQQLRARRIALGLSQGEVGKALGMAAQQVQKYEKGVNAMNAKRLYEFARFLKVPVASFFDALQSPTAAAMSGWVAGAGANPASDRESLEILKSFKRIKDYGLRKRIADLLRALSIKNI